MLTRYIVGAWLWVRGYDLESLPLPYDHSKSIEENRREGRTIEQDLIIEARVPSVMLAVLAMVWVYLIGRHIAGSVAGITAVTLTLINPLVRAFIIRATPDAPFVCFSFLALLLAIHGCRNHRDSGLPFLWSIAVGTALGLALASKLTAAFSLITIAIWCAIVALVAWFRHHGSVRYRSNSSWQAVRGWLLVIAIAICTFVVTNPHLYANPFMHVRHMIEHRSEEMDHQQRTLSDSAITGLPGQIRYVLGGVLLVKGHYKDGESKVWNGIPINVFLVPIGAVASLRHVRQRWKSDRTLPIELLVLLTTIIYLVGMSLTIHMYWPRYLIPVVILCNLVAGTRLIAVWSGLWRIFAHLFTRRQMRHRSSPEEAATVTLHRTARATIESSK